MEENSVDDSVTVWGRSQSDKILRNDNADDDFCAQGELLDQPAKRAWGDFHLHLLNSIYLTHLIPI